MDDQGAGAPGPVPGWPVSAGHGPVGEVLDSVAVPARSVLPEAEPGPAAGARRKRTAVLAGVTVVAVLLTAAGAFAWSALSGGGPQPAEVLPAGTVGVVEVDLNPSAGQKIALYQLLRKFPTSSGLRSSDQSFSDWLMRTVSQDSGGGDLTFTTDIKPWLGQRFAVAAVPSGGHAQAVLVLGETDQAAAAAAMTKLRAHGHDQLGYAFMDGYLVVTPNSRTAAASFVAAAASAPLSTNPRFRSDVASLGSDEVVTGWFDATAAARLMTTAGGSGAGAAQSSGSDLSSVGAVGNLGVDPLFGQGGRGRYVLGLHATSDSLELRLRGFDGASAPAGTPVRVDHVAPGTIGVLAVSGAGAAVARGWRAWRSAPQFTAFDAQARRLGLTLPGDLETLLGDNLQVSVGGGAGSAPSVLAAITSPDPRAGKAVLDRLVRLAGPGTPALAERISGDTLYVGSSAAAVTAGQSTATAQALTSSDLFRRAVADPGRAQSLLFVDMGKVWSVIGASGVRVNSPDLGHLAAVGVSGFAAGSTSDITVRVVFS